MNQQRRILFVCSLGAFCVLVLSLPAIANRVVLLDFIDVASSVTASAETTWRQGESYVVRARLPRIASSPPSSLTVEVSVRDATGRVPASRFRPENGGTRITMSLALNCTDGLWHYYLPAGWPECERIVPGSFTIPSTTEVNLNRYLDIRSANSVSLSLAKE